MTQALKQPDELMTVGKLPTWGPTDGRSRQLVDGTPMATVPPSWRRNSLPEELHAVIRNEGSLVLDSIGFRTLLLDLHRSTSLHPGTAA